MNTMLNMNIYYTLAACYPVRLSLEPIKGNLLTYLLTYFVSITYYFLVAFCSDRVHCKKCTNIYLSTVSAYMKKIYMAGKNRTIFNEVS